MATKLTHTLTFLLVLAGCASSDTDGESLDLAQDAVDESADSAEGADEQDHTALESGETSEEQPVGERTEPADGVFHAHVPRLPE